MFLRIGMDGDTIALPPDGPTAWVALADLAEGIARILVAPDGEARESARTLSLTGPPAVDFLLIAGFLGGILGRPIGRKNISGQEFIRRAAQSGMSAALAQVLASGFRSRAAGELTEISPALEQILGRRLRTVEEELPRLVARRTGKPDPTPPQASSARSGGG